MAEPLPTTPATDTAVSILRLRGWVRQGDALAAEVAQLVESVGRLVDDVAWLTAGRDQALDAVRVVSARAARAEAALRDLAVPTGEVADRG